MCRARSLRSAHAPTSTPKSALLFGPVLFPHPHPRLASFALGIDGVGMVIGATHRIAFSHCASGLQLGVTLHVPTATEISRELGAPSLTTRRCG